MYIFFNDTATTEIYTLSLHDALPIFDDALGHVGVHGRRGGAETVADGHHQQPGSRVVDVVVADAEGAADDLEDRKSTRLNSSHANISYAVFCLQKKITNCVDTSYPYS